MIEYPEARRHIDGMFEHFTGRRPPNSAYKQALFPQGSKLLPNALGTAMGALLELDNVLFATLPGVPAEMQRMFEDTIESLIRKRSEGVIVSLLLRFAGIREEELGEKLQVPSRRLGSYDRSLGRSGQDRSGRGRPSPHHKGLHVRGSQQEDRTSR